MNFYFCHLETTPKIILLIYGLLLLLLIFKNSKKKSEEAKGKPHELVYHLNSEHFLRQMVEIRSLFHNHDNIKYVCATNRIPYYMQTILIIHARMYVYIFLMFIKYKEM